MLSLQIKIIQTSNWVNRLEKTETGEWALVFGSRKDWNDFRCDGTYDSYLCLFNWRMVSSDCILCYSNFIF